jgi:hypothetical protein
MRIAVHQQVTLRVRELFVLVLGLAVAVVACAPALSDTVAAPPARPRLPPPPPPPQPSLRSAVHPPETVYTAAAPSAGPCVVEGTSYPVAHCPEEAIPTHAAQLLGCPAENVAVRRVLLGNPRYTDDAMFAEGCGERLIYSVSKYTKREAFNRVTYSYRPTEEWFVVSRFGLPQPASLSSGHQP